MKHFEVTGASRVSGEANRPFTLELKVCNQDPSQILYGVECLVFERPPRFSILGKEPLPRMQGQCLMLDPQENAVISGTCSGLPRGYYDRLYAVQRTLYPFGLLSKFKVAELSTEIAVLPVQANRSAELLDVLLKTADKEMKALLEGKEKDKAQLSNAVLRVLSLLECLRGRDDKATEAFLIQTFGQRAKLAAIKGDHGGGDIFERVVSLMGSSSKKALALLVETHKSLSGNDLVQAFFGACRTKKPAEVFDVFGPYLAVKVDEKKKKKDPAAEKRESIAQAILVGDHSAYSYRMARRYYGGHDVDEHQKILAQLDPRWLDVAIEIGHVDLVSLLAKPGNVAAGNVLMKSFEEGLAKKSIHDFMNALVALVRIQHPEAADAVIKTIVKHSKGTTYGLWWVGRLIPDLPKSTIPKFDAVLATLPEKRVDELLDFITQLKNKP